MTDNLVDDISNKIVQKESITLKKMSKGYNWEIKIFIEEKKDKETLDRLDNFNTELINKYGNQTD
jgi:hypothetical protein